MKNYETPCGWESCEKNEIVEMDEVLIDIANHSYESATPVFDDQDNFYMTEPILKFKKFGINGNSKIEFDLDNDNNYYALVIDELEIQNGELNKKEIIFQWFQDNLGELQYKLKGNNGTNANSPNGLGAHGLPGGKGSKGGTRHSPTIFIFIKTLKLTSTQKDDVSFEFKLKGILGGMGGQGGNGSDGNQGKRGSHGRQGGIFRACKSGQKGKIGGQAGKGGQGGNGGCGGNGPELSIMVDQVELWEILERSKFDVSGSNPILQTGENGNGYGGRPGQAGKPGIGGKGGKRAGNCGSGNRGESGSPSVNSATWNNWNLGFGLPGTAGIDGNYDFDEFEDVYRIVFNDPTIQTVDDN